MAALKKYINIRYVVLFALLLLVPLFVTDNYLIQSFIMILLYAYWASSWNIIGGYAGQMSIGHATFVGIGAYVSTVLFIQMNISPWIGMLIGAFISAIFGVLVGYPTFKLKGVYYTLSTMALVNVVRLYILSKDTVFGFETGGPLGIKVPWRGGSFADMQFLEKKYYAFIIIGMLAVVLLVSSYIKHSKTGYYLAAITTNQQAASSLGVDVTYYKLKAQFISCFFTAIGGSFYAQLILFLDPNRILGYDLSVELTVLAMVGGSSTVFGPVLGAFLLVPVNEWCRINLGARMAGLPLVIYGLVLMLIVYYLPRGLLYNIQALLKKLFHKKAAVTAKVGAENE
ncbi:branched-chain amino acid ABC transporter permease [Oscillospiraceae bacterium MB08-C2-2]|nr:branched-chain amino acid ABC transporter permease [Oscillospiraceae bacterium MB08-C2-2]